MIDLVDKTETKLGNEIQMLKEHIITLKLAHSDEIASYKETIERLMLKHAEELEDKLL